MSEVQVLKSLTPAQVESILGSVFRVTLSGPYAVGNTGFSRRYIKLFEELGEVSEAYLDVTGGGRKKKTYEDVLEEQVDAVIVLLDIAVLAAIDQVGAVSLPQVREVMTRHLNKCLEKSGSLTYASRCANAFEVSLRQFYLMGSAAYLQLGQSDFYLVTLTALDGAFQLLFSDAESLWSGRPNEGASDARVQRIATLFEQKCEKWERNRATRVSAV